MFMDRRTLYCQDVSSSQLDHRFNTIPIKIPASYLIDIDRQTDSKVYMERQKTQKSQHNIKGEEQSWRTDTTQL